MIGGKYDYYQYYNYLLFFNVANSSAQKPDKSISSITP
jgi:hypothetical protein